MALCCTVFVRCDTEEDRTKPELHHVLFICVSHVAFLVVCFMFVRFSFHALQKYIYILYVQVKRVAFPPVGKGGSRGPITVTLETAPGKTSDVTCRLLVAADGGDSKVRGVTLSAGLRKRPGWGDRVMLGDPFTSSHRDHPSRFSSVTQETVRGRGQEGGGVFVLLPGM